VSLMFGTDRYLKRAKVWVTSLGKGKCTGCGKRRQLYRGRPGRYWCERCWVKDQEGGEAAER
jgi:hypothetical protein